MVAGDGDGADLLGEFDVELVGDDGGDAAADDGAYLAVVVAAAAGDDDVWLQVAVGSVHSV